jgi:hypothetical protein
MSAELLTEAGDQILRATGTAHLNDHVTGMRVHVDVNRVLNRHSYPFRWQQAECVRERGRAASDASLAAFSATGLLTALGQGQITIQAVIEQCDP